LSEKFYHDKLPVWPKILKTKNLSGLKPARFLLSDQGSNLDSSEPKSDVLPVTPSDNAGTKIKKVLKNGYLVTGCQLPVAG
jgi:hypothetical protein